MVKKLALRKFVVSKRKSKKLLGDSFEAQALQELQRLGWSILESQYHTPYGEIDIIALRNGCVWFVEVKGSSGSHISYERVSKVKQVRLQRSAEYWLAEYDSEYEELEMVVCFRTDTGLDWIRNAFDGAEEDSRGSSHS